MKQIYLKFSMLLLCMVVGMSAWAQAPVDIATATFNGKESKYTEGWTTTGTGVGRTDCVIIGDGENITSPEFDFSQYSEVIVTINARRYGTLTGSKATIKVNFAGEDVGELNATGTSATAKIGSLTFVPSTKKGVFVITCSNATSAGSTHGAGVNTITIQGKVATSDPYLTIQSYTYDASATSGYLKYTLDNAIEGTKLTATVTGGDWISNVAVDEENSKVTFDMEPNTSTERTATIKLSYGTYTFAEGTVTQKKFVKDFVSLPFVVAAGTTSATLKDGDGITATLDGTDYSNEDHKLKFSKNTHYIIIKTDQQIGMCAFNFRGCAGAGNSSFELLGSADGTNWTSIETIAIAFEKKDECKQFCSSKAFDPSFRYVKLACTKVTGEVNCGLGEFTIYPVAKMTTATLALPAVADDVHYATFSSKNVAFFPSATISTVVVGEDGLVITPAEVSVLPISEEKQTGYFVPANTGVLISSESATTTYYEIENYQVVEPISNMLRPATAAMEGDYKFYKLAYGDATAKTDLGFYYGTADGAAFTCKAGLAYLAVPAEAAVKSFVLGADATAIKSVNTSTSSSIYNLNGQRLSGLQKGINIVDGKKLFVK